MARDGQQPRRDLVLAFFADEEAGGTLGASYVTSERPGLFAGCQEAIGEVGGFSYSLTPKRRAYFVSTAEKGVWWARLVAEGRAGHGSMINPDNPVRIVAEAVAQISRFFDGCEFLCTRTAEAMLDTLREVLETPAASVDAVLRSVGPLERMLRAGLCNTVNPTQLQAGFKSNVVPAAATATLDGRFVPGAGEQFLAAVASLAADRVRLETLYFGEAIEARRDSPLLGAISSTLSMTDPLAIVVPYMSTAFTDAKWLSRLGIQCYGFAPMQLPDDLDFTALFHGVDERVPASALDFGTVVLRSLFAIY
jgi:acetylornithine deacetylase/succinyl-diaminopimelate desuccinylase-like protein